MERHSEMEFYKKYIIDKWDEDEEIGRRGCEISANRSTPGRPGEGNLP
jgi:hypothetical protein